MTAALRTEIAALPSPIWPGGSARRLYVYDAAMMLRRLGDLAAFDHVRYAQKACSNLAVLDLLRRHGALVDTVSGGEIRRALAAGYLPEGSRRRSSTPPTSSTPRPSTCASSGGIHVNCGSPDMIDQLGRRAAGRAITLRINPGFGHGHSRKTNTGGEQSKHGIWHEQIAACLGRASGTGWP